MTGYLADKSALARLHIPSVADAIVPLMERGLVSICGVTELELLFSARNIQERSRMKQQIEDSLVRAQEPDDLWAQASEVQEALTEKGQHRAASIPDLVVAVTARASRLTVLHYDNDFDTIAAFTEQPTRWVVPAGTV
ncbi:PIN domain nuclease [Catenulispora rubra]|uniref:PIN domain nuclease n=1 Tax=Catenulispora rubra TaxID=280293 RepID=UPI002B267707|nr:PIN domain nuclease [Catenulispora rubra]